MDRTILIVAFDFPPAATSSGMQRALKVVRYLREFGWRPIVLTAQPRAYANTNPSQLSEIPDDVPVYRAFGIDTRRVFSIRNRYPGFVAWPDPWISWWPDAVRVGRRIIRHHQPQVIWSTYPIRTTNLVASSLAKWSGLPWVSDLRDPITLDGYPPDAMRFRLARRIERNTVRHAARVVFTAEFTRRLYEERYPLLSNKSVVIPNGYDESNFPTGLAKESTGDGRLTLLHSGALQPKGRNPRAFFEGLKRLKSNGVVDSTGIRVVFRACGFEDQYQEIARSLGVDDLVEFGGYIPYDKALGEMVNADALLVFQGTAYNHAVPAKLYEYFFAHKPILGILDKSGETRRVLEDVGIAPTSDINDPTDIANHIKTLLGDLGPTSPYVANTREIKNYSRRSQTRRLAELLNTVLAERSAGN